CFDFDVLNNTCSGGGVVDTPGSEITHTFMAGTHTVTLYINNGFGCSHDTAFQTIGVSPAPVADFSLNNNVCAATQVNFVQQSVAPSGSFLSEFNWRFGDGDSSSLSSPNHTYTAAGTYPVCLTVSSSFGCVDTACRPVTILNTPRVDFSAFDTCVN